uniref:Uncharacterized protein LOC103322777 n=1 Tax=Rhizophora mucronata TaxID=61149 RepID=A0A2P2K4P4_RHIMU
MEILHPILPPGVVSLHRHNHSILPLWAQIFCSTAGTRASLPNSKSLTTVTSFPSKGLICLFETPISLTKTLISSKRRKCNLKSRILSRKTRCLIKLTAKWRRPGAILLQPERVFRYGKCRRRW